MPRRKASQKSAKGKNKRTAEQKLNAQSPDSGNVSPVGHDSPRPAEDDHRTSGSDWKDNIINYYQNEAKMAWVSRKL